MPPAQAEDLLRTAAYATQAGRPPHTRGNSVSRAIPIRSESEARAAAAASPGLLTASQGPLGAP